MKPPVTVPRTIIPTILAALVYAADMEHMAYEGLKQSDKREAAKARRRQRRFLAVAARVGHRKEGKSNAESVRLAIDAAMQKQPMPV